MVALLNPLSVKVVGFGRIIHDYPSCRDFIDIYTALQDLSSPPSSNYYIHDRYLFKGTHLCIPSTSLRDYLVMKLHVGGLAGHFGLDKTITIVEDRFCGSSFKRDATCAVSE